MIWRGRRGSPWVQPAHVGASHWSLAVLAALGCGHAEPDAALIITHGTGHAPLLRSTSCLGDGHWVAVPTFPHEDPPVLVLDSYAGHGHRAQPLIAVWKSGEVMEFNNVETADSYRTEVRQGQLATDQVNALWQRTNTAMNTLPRRSTLLDGIAMSGAHNTYVWLRNGSKWLLTAVDYSDDQFIDDAAAGRDTVPESLQLGGETFSVTYWRYPVPRAFALSVRDIRSTSASAQTVQRPAIDRSEVAYDVGYQDLYKGTWGEPLSWPSELPSPPILQAAECDDGNGTRTADCREYDHYPPSANQLLRDVHKQIRQEPRRPVQFGERVVDIGVWPSWDGERTLGAARRCASIILTQAPQVPNMPLPPIPPAPTVPTEWSP